MDLTLLTTLIVGVFGGGGLVTLIQFFVKRKDNKNDELADIKNDLKQIKKEIVESQKDRKRQQLLTMMYHNPTNVDTICEIARVYFKVLGGNWYMDTEFQKWLNEQKVPAPSWFNKK